MGTDMVLTEMKTTFWLAEQWVLDTFWCMILNHPSKFSYGLEQIYKVLNMQRILIIILQVNDITAVNINIINFEQTILKTGWDTALWARVRRLKRRKLKTKSLWMEKIFFGPALVIIKQINFTTCLISQKFDFISKVKPSFCKSK